jgi:hypothetical protein
VRVTAMVEEKRKKGPHLAVPGSRRSTSPNPAADDRSRLPLM